MRYVVRQYKADRPERDKNMLGVEYILALIKILFHIAFAIIVAIPFKPAWNCVAANYLTPKIVSVSQTNTNGSGK